MNRIMLFTLGSVLLGCSSFSGAQTNKIKMLEAKMDQAELYLNNTSNTPKAWALAVDIANIVKQNPEYDDGEFAEGMIDVVGKLLTKPWNYARPYLTGSKGSASFRQFILNHINELSDPEDLKVIKKNVSRNCEPTKYPICQQLLTKIENSMP